MTKLVEHDHADGGRRTVDPTLWAIYHRSADEWRACHTQDEAEQRANYWNDIWAKRKRRSEFDPHMWCIPDLWPFTADEHAADLSREDVSSTEIEIAVAST